VFKVTSALSGGELARVALAVLSIEQPNVLILDEPTTHLDIASQEILQDVLMSFRGTILFVSHDRYLIDALATHVFWIEEGRLFTLEGGYADYIAHQRERNLSQREEISNIADDEEQRRRQRREQLAARRRVEQMESLEEEIERVERELTVTSDMIERASSAQDVARLHTLGVKYGELESLLAQHLREWERLASVEENAD
jgi:ATP-binding cassette subfamily F protein 3